MQLRGQGLPPTEPIVEPNEPEVMAEHYTTEPGGPPGTTQPNEPEPVAGPEVTAPVNGNTTPVEMKTGAETDGRIARGCGVGMPAPAKHVAFRARGVIHCGKEVFYFRGSNFTSTSVFTFTGLPPCTGG
jgi:hypothetical protein